MAEETKDRAIILIPFPGFYESILSGSLDQAEEMEAYNYEEKQNEYDLNIPRELRLTQDEIGGEFWQFVDYAKAHDYLVREWVASFTLVLKNEYDLDLSLEFESMSSPREYNFTTDRCFAYIPREQIQMLFDESAAEDHKHLAERIKERHTSYDGFHSFYRNDLADWLEKPLDDWDHNELQTLLESAIIRHGAKDPDSGDFTWQVVENMSESDDFYMALDGATKWGEFEAKLDEMREAKAEELRKADPDYVPPPARCKDTPDLFKPE